MDMINPFLDIRGMEFLPLSEVKAKLSALMRLIIGQKKRMVVTTNGRPTAVMLSYKDYLELLKQTPAREDVAGAGEVERTIDFEEWKRSRKQRRMASESIRRLFIPEELPRKGRKKYKEEMLRALSRRSQG